MKQILIRPFPTHLRESLTARSPSNCPPSSLAAGRDISPRRSPTPHHRVRHTNPVWSLRLRRAPLPHNSQLPSNLIASSDPSHCVFCEGCVLRPDSGFTRHHIYTVLYCRAECEHTEVQKCRVGARRRLGSEQPLNGMRSAICPRVDGNSVARFVSYSELQLDALGMHL